MVAYLSVRLLHVRDDEHDRLDQIKKADFGVIFAGSGLIHGLNRDMDKLIWFMEGLNEYGEFYLIPMVKGYNMRGFVEMMKRAQRQIEGSFLRALLDGGIDAALIIGADPMSDLPYSLSKKLLDIQTIVIDPRDTCGACVFIRGCAVSDPRYMHSCLATQACRDPPG